MKSDCHHYALLGLALTLLLLSLGDLLLVFEGVLLVAEEYVVNY